MPQLQDNDGGLGGHSWSLTDSAGDRWIFWYDKGAGTDHACYVNRQVSGVWQTKIKLLGTSGVAYTATAIIYDVIFNAARTRIHLIFRDVGSSFLRYTTLLDLSQWDVGTAWKQNDESTAGTSQVEGVFWWDAVAGLDSAGNLFIGGYRDGNQGRVGKRGATSPFTWSFTNVGGSGTIRVASLFVTTNDFVHYFVGTTGANEAVDYYKSTAASGITFGSLTVVTSFSNTGQPARTFSVNEETDDKMVIFQLQANTTPMRWNYWNGSSWTQGTAGATTGLSRTANMDQGAINTRRHLCRDGAKNVYLGFWDTTQQYRIVKFATTTWTASATIDVGAGDAFGELALEQRPPSTATAAGVGYIDLAGGATDELYYDTFAITAAAGGGTASTGGRSLGGSFFRGR